MKYSAVVIANELGYLISRCGVVMNFKFASVWLSALGARYADGRTQVVCLTVVVFVEVLKGGRELFFCVVSSLFMLGTGALHFQQVFSALWFAIQKKRWFEENLVSECVSSLFGVCVAITL